MGSHLPFDNLASSAIGTFIDHTPCHLADMLAIDTASINHNQVHLPSWAAALAIEVHPRRNYFDN